MSNERDLAPLRHTLGDLENSNSIILGHDPQVVYKVGISNIFDQKNGVAFVTTHIRPRELDALVAYINLYVQNEYEIAPSAKSIVSIINNAYSNYINNGFDGRASAQIELFQSAELWGPLKEELLNIAIFNNNNELTESIRNEIEPSL
ncbi:hypothetical protein MOB34_05610 [Bacillus spizizenii]|nr:hypothetical protein [Bacillus spizizenii]MCY8229301.1 hypothetical protein [Bacillus spizizenii]MCY8888124.1 hypothetical protein [Bacillus spizizenii]MEC0840268.1 hypothetical protein [Bacillus spizizenii]